MRRDGIFMAVGLRAFALCICGILVFSALMIRKSYTAYKANNALPDIYGYLDPTDSVYEMYIYYYAYVKGFYNIPEGDDYSQERSELLNNPWKERNRFNISFGELKNKLKDDGGYVYSIKYNDEDLIMLEPLLVNYLNRYCKGVIPICLMDLPKNSLQSLIISEEYNQYHILHLNQKGHGSGIIRTTTRWDWILFHQIMVTEEIHQLQIMGIVIYILQSMLILLKNCIISLRNILIKSTEIMMISLMADRL